MGNPIRPHGTVDCVEGVPGDGVQVFVDFTGEVEGSVKPACVSRALYRCYPQQPPQGADAAGMADLSSMVGRTVLIGTPVRWDGGHTLLQAPRGATTSAASQRIR